MHTLSGDRACRIASVVAPCEFSTSFANLLRGSCVSDRSRCGAVRIFCVAGQPVRGSCVSDRSRCGAARIFHLAGQPCAGIVRADRSRCGAVRIFYVAGQPSAGMRNPVRGWCVSDRSRCGAVRTCSAGIVRVESFSLGCRANFGRGLRTFSWSSVGTIAGAWSVRRVCKKMMTLSWFSVADGAGAWSVERPSNSVGNRRPSRGLRGV